ncbi:unnamed protein product [Moneuplotes crassus]|uniref:Uncharacterized protein n=1 Tax=Euplotes crassus TaxID=5936 RepID=A0AAD1XTC3_EUPCR|nr:unnamed protein product [Moneuplotes crassus]
MIPAEAFEVSSFLGLCETHSQEFTELGISNLLIISSPLFVKVFSVSLLYL